MRASLTGAVFVEPGERFLITLPLDIVPEARVQLRLNFRIGLLEPKRCLPQLLKLKSGIVRAKVVIGYDIEAGAQGVMEF